MDKETRSKKKVGLALNHETNAKLDELSKATGITKSSIIDMLVAINADSLLKKYTIRKESGSL